jgi:hypothetical protein
MADGDDRHALRDIATGEAQCSGLQNRKDGRRTLRLSHN